MARSMWNGMISFGLVNVPVGMYPATESKSVAFNQLHKEDGARIKQQKVCSKCEKVLEAGDLEKGYEHCKGSYVVITEDDIKKVKPEASNTIAISAFVDAGEIDAMLYDTPYYLQPAAKQERVYGLLRAGLAKSGKVGIATFVMRGKQHLAAVRACGDFMLLETMRFASDMRAADAMPAVEISEAELGMALQLIGAMAADFDHESYRDSYTEALLSLIENKVAGVEVPSTYVAPQATVAVDLMARLQASLAAAGAAPKPAAEPAAEIVEPKKAKAKSTAKLKLAA